MTLIRPEQDGFPRRAVTQAPVAARLRGHWQALWQADGPRGRLPRRDQLDPRAMGPLLASVFLIDWTESGAARFRIAGQVFTRLYGMQLHGAPLALLFEPNERAEIGRIARAACEGPETVDLVLRSEGGAGRPPIGARMLILPLEDRWGGRTLALGSLEVAGDVGRAPRRFRIERCLRAPLG